MSNTVNFTLLQNTTQDGCFTFEGYLRGQNIMEIARRLGLPQSRMAEGIYIAYALTVPDLNGFELAGVTTDSTDKFVSYLKGSPQYDAEKFKKLYKGININEFKRIYQKLFSSERLVKVICKVPHSDGLHYPQGTLVPQFLMLQKLPCIIGADIPPMGTFR